MERSDSKRAEQLLPLAELLAELPVIEAEKQDLSQHLQEIPLETQLLSLADISIERETEGLKEVFAALRLLA
jgi:hypothetical protein